MKNQVYAAFVAKMTTLTLSVVVFATNVLSAGAQGIFDQFPVQVRNSRFEFYFKEKSPTDDRTVNFADGFLNVVGQSFLKIEFQYPIRAIVFEDQNSFQDFLKQTLHSGFTPEHGIYVPASRLFATYRGSGIGTFAHEIMHPIIKQDLPDRPPWSDEAIPAFFEKFYGYWSNSELIVYWGYQNPWRVAELGTNLSHLNLREMVGETDNSTNFIWVENNESRLREVSLFLWNQGCFKRFLNLIANHDKNGYPTYFEAAMEMQLNSIIPKWQSFLDNAQLHRSEILMLPPSTVCDNEAEFKHFTSSHGIQLDQPKQRD